MLTPEQTNIIARQVAEHIILSHTEDIEWLSICEMSSDLLAEKGYLLASDKDCEEFFHNVDAWISKAKVTVEFPED